MSSWSWASMSCCGSCSTAASGALTYAQRQLPEATEHSMQVKVGKHLMGGCLCPMHLQSKRDLVGSFALCRTQPTGMGRHV